MSAISELPSAAELVSFTGTILAAVRRNNLQVAGKRETVFGDSVSYGLSHGYGVETTGFTDDPSDPNYDCKAVALITPDEQTASLQVRTRRYNIGEETADPIIVIDGRLVAIDRIIFQASGFPAGFEGVHEISGDNVIFENGEVTTGQYRVGRRETNAFDFFKAAFNEVFPTDNQ